MPTLLVIKIVGAAEWDDAKAKGVYDGSPDDQRDGFIHLSAPGQVKATVEKHFAGRDDLLLVSLDTRKLGSALRWEKSRGAEDFPHLYAPLDLKAVAAVEPITTGPNGERIFPKWLPD
jgi:uncharacterized protein (DUF952 family)